MAIYKRVGGEQIKMSSREVKAFIKKVNGWTDEEYNKKYDIFKNKVRAYEAFERQSGRNVKKQSPVELLYKQAKTKKREGANYKPSIYMQNIERFTSVSSGKAGQKALRGKLYRQKRASAYEEATNKAFEALINKNPTAQEINAKIKDPVKKREALSDLAKTIKAKIDEEGKVQENEAIPYGETYGSTEPIDFDFDAYL